MADHQTKTRQGRRVLPDFLAIALFFLTLAWGISEACAQDGPAFSAPIPPAAANPPARPLAPPADAEAETVVDVRISGNKALPLDKILPQIKTRPGRPLDLELVKEDVRRLDHTHQFLNVRTFFQKVSGGQVVIFDVLERPLLMEDPLFVGCNEIRKKRLLKE
jgi:outer membrane protein assembly factor BamA